MTQATSNSVASRIGRPGGRSKAWQPPAFAGLSAVVLVRPVGGCVSWGWAVENGDTGSGRRRGADSSKALAEAVLSLNRRMLGQDVMVLIRDCGARLQALQANAPNLKLVGFAPAIERSQLVDLASAAAASTVTRDDRILDCRQKSLRSMMDDSDGREVIIATDGSVGRDPKAGWCAGWGWISDEGFADAGPLRGVREPAVAELKAVAQACASVPAGRPLVVLTDSRVAVEMVRRLGAGVAPELVATMVPGRYLATVVKLLTVVHRRLDAGPLTVQWVKGHAGHPLQETADRLAVLGRRRYQAGLDDVAALTRAIADEFRSMYSTGLSVDVA